MSEEDMESDTDEGQIAQFLKRAAPYIFEKAILKATTDEERHQLAVQMGDSPLTDFGVIQELLKYSLFLNSEGRESDAALLLKYSKVASNTFLQHRANKRKAGLSLQYEFGGEIIATIGQSLNEGFTEYFTHEIMDEYAKEDQELFTSDELHDFREKNASPYEIELIVARQIVRIFGLDLVARAYFGDVEDFNSFAEAFDLRFGPKSFINLLVLSDHGDWPAVFSLLDNQKPSTMSEPE